MVNKMVTICNSKLKKFEYVRSFPTMERKFVNKIQDGLSIYSINLI